MEQEPSPLRADGDSDGPEIVADKSGTVRLLEMTVVFLRLGLTAFGGPAAHIAMMQQEFVERRRWLSKEEFLDLIGVANLIPGPSSTEVAIYVGLRRAGWKGLIIAGCCFILPAFLLVMAIAWGYRAAGQLPLVVGLLDGVKPVVIAVVLQALWTLGKTAVKTRLLAVVGLVALLPALLDVHPLVVLATCGGVLVVVRLFAVREKVTVRPLLGPVGIVLVFILATIALGRLVPLDAVPGAHSLFMVFLKIGAMVYGSGYVLLRFLQVELVQARPWLTSDRLLDAVAVGQVTPGPVFTTATFIGFLLAGPQGAIAATVGIFLPAFLFVGLTGPLLLRVRQSPLLGAFLDGVNVAALALMATVAWQLGRTAIHSLPTLLLALVSGILLFRFKVNSAWLVLLGALVGMVVRH